MNKLRGLIILAKAEKLCIFPTQVIIAAWNEEEGIGLTVAELMDILENPRVLVVDGRSID
jgi:hypothetical protein